MEENIKYSVNIEKIIKKQGLTIQQMLDNAELNTSSYYRMKQNNKFTTEVLEIIAKTLKVQVSDLVKSDHKVDSNEMKQDFEKIKEVLSEFEDKHIK